MLIFGDRDFSPLPDVIPLFELMLNVQLAVFPGTTHVDATRRLAEVFVLITPFPRSEVSGGLASMPTNHTSKATAASTTRPLPTRPPVTTSRWRC